MMSWVRKNAYKIVDQIRKTDAIGIYDEIVQSQWWSKEDLDKYQYDHLTKLLIHCKKNVPYYTRLFETIQFDPELPFELKDFEKIPPMTKEILRENFEDIKAKNISQYKPRIKTSGGSTGQPINYLNDFKSHSYLAANNLRVWSIGSDYKVGNRFITIAHGSLLPKKSSLKNKVYFFLQNSKLITSYHLDEERLENSINLINGSSARFIYGYSSTIFMIAKYAKAKKLQIRSKIQAIYTTSDMLYKNQRDIIEEVFNVDVYDSYGCPESGIISFECEHHNGYHINQESAFVEILAPNSDGLGKIVSTALHNHAFPLLRYETGDVGKYSQEQCECGRWLPKISHLGGRIRDFVILKDGRYIHGAFFNNLKTIINNNWIDEYQIIQKDIDNLVIRVTMRRNPTENEKKILVEELRKCLLPDIRISIDPNGVEYTSGGKFRLIISEVKTHWEEN